MTVYIPSQYVPGTPAPLIVSCDAYGARNNQLPNILDNMIADHRLPPIVAVMIANGGGDGGGSERGLEYDTVWGKYAEFVEAEILPKVEKDYGVTIKGVAEGFVKKLEIQGVGFKAAVTGKVVNLSLGYSHPVNYDIPDQIKVTVEENTKLTIEGPDKMMVGKVASEIRAFYPPEPYKGKGVRYVGEHVERKEGKTVQ